MRSRAEIEADGKRTDLLILEVLLDIRDSKGLPDIRALPEVKKRMGRPKGSKNKVRRTRKVKAT